MTKAYYLRNEEKSPEGYSAKMLPVENAQELIEQGMPFDRGYVPGDKLVLVNDTPEVYNESEDENLTDFEMAESMFSLYNRKGFGDEREFAGPSMSVGDLVVLVCQGSVTILQCASSSWKVMNEEFTKAENADDLFQSLPLPEMEEVPLTISR